MHSSRLQISKHISKHRVAGHGKQHVALDMQNEDKVSAIKVVPREPVLLQLSEDREEIQKLNRTANPAMWPWAQPGIVTKKMNATAALKQVASNSPSAAGVAPEVTG